MRTIAVLALLLLSGCAIDLPPTCAAGDRIEAISSDRGTLYVCQRIKEDADR